MKETPYITLIHDHDGRVLKVVVDGKEYTPEQVKQALERQKAKGGDAQAIRAAARAVQGVEG